MLALAYTRSRKNALKQYNEALFALSGVSNHNVAPRKGLTNFYINTSSTCIMWLSLTDNISTSSIFECGRCPQGPALTFTFYLWEGDLGFQTRIKLPQRSDLEFVKKFTRPNFWAKEFYTLKTRKSRLFLPAINSKNASLSGIGPSFG